MIRSLIVLSLLPAFLFASHVSYTTHHSGEEPPPWFTGPLLAPSPHAVPRGHVNIEPYIYATASEGHYNHHWKTVKSSTSWTNYSDTVFKIGVLPWMDVQLSPTVYWNYSHPQASWALGDFPVGLNIQLFSSHTTFLKLALSEVVPIGKYRNLNPKKKGTQIGGGGTWNTGVGLVLGVLQHLQGVHFINWRVFVQYAIPAPVHLTGFNAYGGGHGTDAHFVPGQKAKIDLAMEVTLTRNWAFALDAVGSWTAKSHYSGVAGTNSEGEPANLGSHENSFQFSLAPALEYNWSSSIGIIGGVWFTVAGRNSQNFTSGVIAFNYYY